MITRRVDASKLTLNKRGILSSIGMGEGQQDDLTFRLLAEIYAELLPIVQAQYCYTIVDSINFCCGKIIAEAMQKGDRFGIIVATAGATTDAYLHDLKESNIAKAFVGDAVASEIAEAASRAAINEIATLLADGEQISNPYSPGYCGWSLKEQRKLFALFSEQPCGVELNDSCLMLPVKSISSVVALGRDVVKAPYGCEICTKSDCYKKNRK